MNLNIKNSEAHELASYIAEITGESMTRVVTKALKEQLSRLQAERSQVQDLLQIGKNCAGRLKAPYKTIAHGELLYDENGLPK